MKFVDILWHYIECSPLAEGTANILWILLHNDRKSWHRRMKKQRRYERLPWNTSQFLLWVVGDVRHAPGGWVEDALYYRLQGVLRTDFILTRLGVLLMCIHPVKRWYILFYRGEINDNYCHLIYIVTFLRHSLDHIGYSAYDSQLGVD